VYNITQLMNTTNYGDYLVILNTESGGVLGATILVIIAIVFLITFHKEGIANAATASGFITTIAAIIMFAIGFLPPMFIMYPVMLMAGGFIAKKLGGD